MLACVENSMQGACLQDACEDLQRLIGRCDLVHRRLRALPQIQVGQVTSATGALDPLLCAGALSWSNLPRLTMSLKLVALGFAVLPGAASKNHVE